MSRILVSTMLMLGGCQREVANRSPEAPPLVVAQNRPPALDKATTERCRHEIRYPTLTGEFAPLLAALQDYAAWRKREFLAACAAAPPVAENAMAWELQLNFDVRSTTRDFVSVLAEGSQFMGGAHGNPVLASFTYGRRSGRVLGLLDLFADPQAALALLSSASRQALLDQARKARADSGPETDEQHWIRDGTTAKVENFTTFTIQSGPDDKAQGLNLIFPAYQVAPYADGPQQVTLPARAFIGQLKAEYRNAFVTGTAH